MTNLDLPNYLSCLTLRATISLRQCQINRHRGQVYPDSLYHNCRKCPAGKSVAIHYQGPKVSVREVKQTYSNSQQSPEPLVRAKMAGKGRLIRKETMVQEIVDHLRAAGTPEKEVVKRRRWLYDGNTAQVREEWEMVFGND